VAGKLTGIFCFYLHILHPYHTILSNSLMLGRNKSE